MCSEMQESAAGNEPEFFSKIRHENPKGLIIAYLNINSLRHKIFYVHSKLQNKTVDIIGIAETKLNDTFPDAQFNIDGYRSFRKDRNGSGGGLWIYVRSDDGHST